MAKSAKERVAEYRRRRKENADLYEQYKAAERERYHKRREKGQIKTIDQLTERGKRTCRRRWASAKQESRKRQQMRKEILTPPATPERPFEEVHNDYARSQAMRVVHQKRRNRERAACYRENTKLIIKLKNQTRLTEKYKKRYNRQQCKLTKPIQKIPKFNKKSHLLYTTLINNIRQWYNRNNGRLDRRKVADVIIGKRLLKKYGIGAYCCSTLGISRRYTQERRKINPLRKVNIKERVCKFLTRDDNSRIKADKRATITRKGEKKQIHLLKDDLKTLHRKYLLEGNKISYSLFCKLRPFWVLRPTEKDRSTCLCKIHENLYFKINTCYTQNMVNSKDPNILMKSITCDTAKKECMYRECDKCKNLTFIPENVTEDQVSWNEWTSKRIEKEGPSNSSKIISMTVKEKRQGSKEILAEEINKDFQRACRHIYNIRHQYQSMTMLKEKMSDKEVLLHIDFSENYNTKYESEIQSMHFGASRRQISLHTGVAYIGHKVYPFCTVSDCLRHGPSAIWAHLDPVIQYIKSITPLEMVHFLSDGPTTQYRNKMNFYLWNKAVYDYGFSSSMWNFLEASHGKGAADGIGAAIKRAADHQVNVKEQDITNAKDLINAVQPSSSVKMFLVEEYKIEAIDEILPSDLSTISGTMKIHQLNSSRRGEVSWRVLSCFCVHPSKCECFQPQNVHFPRETIIVTEGQAEVSSPSLSSPNTIPGNQSRPTSNHRGTAISSIVELQKVHCVEEALIGRYLVVCYDGLPFPGIVLDVDEEDLEVKVMHRVGKNRYFWPMMDDQCWYSKDKVVTMLEKKPEQVTSRHCELPQYIWELIEKELHF